MPPLTDPRHEKFCQAQVNENLTVDRAYEAAGYKRNSSNAARLNGKDSIKNRIKELTEERDRKTAEYAVLSRGDLLKRLHTMIDADMRNFYRPDGTLKPIHELDDETAAALQAFEVSLTPAKKGKRASLTTASIRRADKKGLIQLYSDLAGYFRPDQANTLTPVTLEQLVMQSLQLRQNVNVTVNVQTNGGAPQEATVTLNQAPEQPKIAAGGKT